MAKTTKRKNPADATNRNVRAANKKIDRVEVVAYTARAHAARLEVMYFDLQRRVKRLERATFEPFK